MARINQIGRPQLGNAYGRVLGVDDTDAVTTLAPEVLPVMSLNERPEFWTLQGGKMASAGIALAAGGAGTFGLWQVVNPVGSGILIILEKVWLGTAAIYHGGVAITTGLSGLVTRNVQHRDTRWARDGLNNSAMGGQLRASALAGTLLGQWAFNGVAQSEFNVEVILSPGFSVQVELPTANTAGHVAFMWRERVASEQELQPV